MATCTFSYLNYNKSDTVTVPRLFGFSFRLVAVLCHLRSQFTETSIRPNLSVEIPFRGTIKCISFFPALLRSKLTASPSASVTMFHSRCTGTWHSETLAPRPFPFYMCIDHCVLAHRSRYVSWNRDGCTPRGNQWSRAIAISYDKNMANRKWPIFPGTSHDKLDSRGNSPTRPIKKKSSVGHQAFWECCVMNIETNFAVWVQCTYVVTLV